MMVKKRRTPGNRNVMHKTVRKTTRLECQRCGALLHGVRRMGVRKLANSPASQKRASRAFGSMCPSCSRSVLRERARSA